MSEISLAARVGRIKPSPTIAVSTRAQEMKADGRDVINLGAGEPDFDTPPHIKDAAAAAMKNGQTKYTAVGGTPELKKAVCEKFSRENNLEFAPPQIIVSTGAKHCLLNLMLATLDESDEVVIPAPYWVSYPDMALLAGAKPVIAQCGDDYKMTPQTLRAAMSPKTKMVILNSPSNPSGALYSKKELAALAAAMDDFPKALAACDDIYEHLRYGGRPFATLLNARPDFAKRTAVINGVSKAYAMTGWRIGYAAGPEEIIRAMTKIQSQATSNPCSIAQAAAAAALRGGLDCVAPMLEAFDRRRQLVQEGLNKTSGVRCGEIEGAFYAFADAGEAIGRLHESGTIAEPTDLAFCGHLLETAEVAAVPGSAFGMPGHFRVSFAAADNLLSEALTRIQTALS